MKPARPTIRELLDWLDKPDDLDPQVVELADRVEAVLKLDLIDYAASDQAGGYNDCLRLVRSLLNGEP